MTRKTEECSQYILKHGKKRSDTAWKLYTGHAKVLSLGDAATATELASVCLICLPAWHRLENSPVKSCSSVPQTLCINQSNKARKSSDLYSAGEYRVSSFPGRARHLRFLQCQRESKSFISSLSLVCTKVWTHTCSGVTRPPATLLKRVFCQRARAPAQLPIRSEIQPRNRE